MGLKRNCNHKVITLAAINCNHTIMNNKHRKTLRAVFANPVNGGLHFDRIEALLLAVGCERMEARESAVLFSKDGQVVQFHRPHPQREALRYWVKAAREFLERIGVKP